MAVLSNWLLLFLACIAMISLALYCAHTITFKKGEGGFLLAANSLGPLVGAFSVVATGFSGWGFMGSPGVAYKYGAIELLGNFFFAPAMVFAVLFCARFLYQKSQKMNSLTLPEYIAKSHHGPAAMKRITQGICAIITVFLLLVFLVGQIKALGMLAGPWLHINPNVASLIMVTIIIIYTAIGGLAAVAYIDTFMVIGMCLSALVIVGTVFTDISFSQLLTRIYEIDPELLSPKDSGPYGSTVFHVFMILPYAFIYSATLPYMSVRFMALSKKTKLHHVAAYMTPVACLLSLVPIVGLYTRIMKPDLSNPDQAMPVFLANFLSPAISGVITLFILFATKSTASSVLHTITGAVSHDLRMAIWPQYKIDSKKLLLLDRVMVLVLGLLAFTLMLFAPPMMLSMLAILSSGTLMAALVAPTLLAHLVQGNIFGALAACICGFSSALILFLYFDMGWVEAPLYASAFASVIYCLFSELFKTRTVEREKFKTPATTNLPI